MIILGTFISGCCDRLLDDNDDRVAGFFFRCCCCFGCCLGGVTAVEWILFSGAPSTFFILLGAPIAAEATLVGDDIMMILL